MRFTPNGLPSGFGDGAHTTLRMVENVGGDILALGDGVTVRNISIEDFPGRSGNVVAVVSRRPGDRISATMENVAILNPNPLAIGAGGTTGRSIMVITRNPNLGSDPAPDTGSVLALRILRSLVSSPAGGGGFFAFNFAAKSRISIQISRSVIGGGNEANGGVSRPDAVNGSQVSITSEGSLYRNDWADRCASPMSGWNLTGGSTSPLPLAVPETEGNRLSFHSVNDRMEGFTTSVLATGSRRFFPAPLNAAPSGNHIDLQLTGTTIITPPCPTAITSSNTGMADFRDMAAMDLRLIGAWVANDGISPGDSNTVRAEFRGVTGSGMRANFYAHTAAGLGPVPPHLQGIGNRLEMTGDPQAFTRANRGIDPPPPATFFSIR